MTKPKFNRTVCFHCGVDKAVEIAKAFEQGKLAGKKELIDQMCKPMEEENALCDRRLGDCMPCEERKKRIKELKSQLSEKRVFSEVFSQKSSKEAKK